MAEYLSSLRKGMILVFGVRDEGSFNLKDIGRKALQSLGSRKVTRLDWRDTWVFVCQKGVSGWLAEVLYKSPII